MPLSCPLSLTQLLFLPHIRVLQQIIGATRQHTTSTATFMEEAQYITLVIRPHWEHTIQHLWEVYVILASLNLTQMALPVFFPPTWEVQIRKCLIV